MLKHYRLKFKVSKKIRLIRFGVIRSLRIITKVYFNEKIILEVTKL